MECAEVPGLKNHQAEWKHLVSLVLQLIYWKSEVFNGGLALTDEIVPLICKGKNVCIYIDIKEKNRYIWWG